MDYNELFSRPYTPAHADVPETAESVLIAMGKRSGKFDIDKFKATGAGAAAARMMEITITQPDEHAPDAVAFWAKRGMVKEFHGEKEPMDWEDFLARRGVDGDFDPENTFPQNRVKKWTSFVPVSAFDPAHAGRKYPLVFVLHGAGNTVYAIDSWGFVNAAAEREWIVIAPSLENDEVILDILEQAKSLYPVDESRVYVCGFSYGSMNTNILAMQHPEVFAAAAPCGGFLRMPGGTSYPKRPGFVPTGPQEPRYLLGDADVRVPVPVMSVMGNRDGDPWPLYASSNRDAMLAALRYWGGVNGADIPDDAAVDALAGGSATLAEAMLGIPLAAGCGRVETSEGTDFAIGDFPGRDGISRIRIVCEDNVPHWPTPHLSRLVLDFFSRFRRDPVTGESIAE